MLTLKNFTTTALSLASLLGLIFTVSHPAFGADGSSGCGAGWYLFQKNSLVSSTLRGTTNGFLSNQTFGMTFGTSNCQKHDIVRKEKEAIYYAENNREVLMLQLAEGRGEYVSGYAQVMGCETPAGVAAFGNELQKNYEKVLPHSDASPAEMLENTKTIMIQNPAVLRACGVQIS